MGNWKFNMDRGSLVFLAFKMDCAFMGLDNFEADS